MLMARLGRAVGLLLLAVAASVGSSPEEITVGESLSSPCSESESKANCGNCIRTSHLCAWCSSENFPWSESRCELYDRLKDNCPAADLVYPRTSLTLAQNHDVSGGRSAEPIQVQPQVINMTVRTNEPVNFKLKFRQAENYPVDLYFLLDLSRSMVNEPEARTRLSALGEDMPTSMEDITTNFRLGFGTFVDKKVMPYTAWTEQLLINRCPGNVKSCSDPHDFINQLGLNSNVSEFKVKMTDALRDVSQSFDDYEGGMDGLVQALVCEKEIGWHERSRRIIVYSSNSMFHVAGDGRLGGAIKNNDGQCHLNNQGSYSPADVEFDYPSVSQIASVLEKKSASVIFAVMKNVSSHYEKLKALLGSAEIGLLENNSSNIVHLIRNIYDKLRSKIAFIPKRADGVDFKFKSKCLRNVVEETRECEGLEIGQEVEFDVTMTVPSVVCEGRKGVTERSVELAAQGLNEKLTINLNILCSCQCEQPDFSEVNSLMCSEGNGTLECGICSCSPGRHGRTCECDESEFTSQQSLAVCRKSNDTEVCSGRGDCFCGKCFCFPISKESLSRVYSGDHCECNDHSCARSEVDASLCGGPTHGICNCGQCQCLPGWKDRACDCSTDNSTCTASNGISCNDKGICECGRCRCLPDSGFTGPTCEECPACPTKCTEYRDCAQCKGFGTGKYSTNECNELCADKTFQTVDELEKGNDQVRSCSFRDTDNCLSFFTYQYDEKNNVIIKVQKTKECPTETNLALILIPIVAAVVLIPLLFIFLFILFRNRKDALEYARFMKEKDSARWDSGANPIYKDPTTTFANPSFQG